MTAPYSLILQTYTQSLLFMLLCLTQVVAQPEDCTCLGQLTYLQNEIETNHPGFKVNMKEIGAEKYQKALASLREQVSADTLSEKSCLEFLNQYLRLFKDKHLKVYKAQPNLPKRDRGLSQMLFKPLNPKTLYVRLPTFYKSYWREIDAFYDTLVPQIARYSQIILDLRNNGGGGERLYLELLKSLRQSEPMPQKIAVLMNGGGRQCLRTIYITPSKRPGAGTDLRAEYLRCLSLWDGTG